MVETEIQRHKTAMFRYDISRPIRLALEEGIITKETCVFDYGCGRGGDLQRLKRKGISCAGWDPKHRPQEVLLPSDVVNLGYVLNVIEEPTERIEVLKKAWALAQRVLIVAAQHVMDAKNENAESHKDGVLTRIGTFQKYYQQHELRDLLNESLNAQSVAIAPGIFYVFRDDGERQNYLASRTRRRPAPPRKLKTQVLFEEHQPLFEALMAFLQERGRLPDALELDASADIQTQIGSLKKAFGIVKKMTGEERWEQLRVERSLDLIIYLALIRFEGRPKFSELPFSLQQDVKGLYRNYKNACAFADDLLFSVGDMEVMEIAFRASRVGKMTPKALYVHESALHLLPPELRVYEGCAKAFIGQVENANIIKLHRIKSKVSYLYYPNFDEDPHPSLHSSVVVNLQTFHVDFRDYSKSENPPILHRKEEFVNHDYPRYDSYILLTKAEECYGLYKNTATIGFKAHWEQLLQQQQLYLDGHQLMQVLTE